MLAGEGMADAEVELVWDAIALHTTMGVPPRKRPEVALVQLGAAIDVGYVSLDAVIAELPAILEAWPRLGFKSELVRYFDRLYERNPEAALQSPVAPDIIARRHGVRSRNVCDVIAGAGFAE
jgi:hypothetical protein